MPYDMTRNTAQVSLQPGRNASTAPIQSPAVSNPGASAFGSSFPGTDPQASVGPGGFAFSAGADQMMQAQPSMGGAFALGDGSNPILNNLLREASTQTPGAPGGGSGLNLFRASPQQPSLGLGAPNLSRGAR